MPDEVTDPTIEAKAGARHSAADQSHMDAALEHLHHAGAQLPPTPEGDAPPAKSDDTLITFGASVKALGDGRIGGYLVRFSGSADPDLTGDFFDAKTDLGTATTSDTYYNHGLDRVIGKRVIGQASLKRDDIGVWAETQLALRDEYEKAVYALAEKGKLGWSSGTAAHLVEREAAGKAMHITRWPLGLDASLTPTPAEPRNAALSLKSLISGQTPGQAEPDGSPAANSSAVTTKEFDMTDEELKALRDEQAADRKAMADLKAQNEELLTELRKPQLKAALAQVEAVKDKNDRPFKSLGEQVLAVRDRELHTATTEQINRLDAVKAFNMKATGAGELVQSEGGALVQSDFSTDIFQRSYATGALTSRCAKQTIGAQFNGTKIPAVDEQSRADGSRFGGIQAYWAAEAAQVTKSKPTWRHAVLELKKLFALVYGTDELLADVAAFDSFLMRVLPLEIGFKLDDAIINGLGGGIPMGLLAAPATVSVAKETGQAAASIVYANIVKMYARQWAGGMANAVWFINQDTLPSLFQMSLTVGTGGAPVFLPPGGLSASPYSTLLARPVIPVEQCATLGTVGDIILADLSQYALAEKGGINAQQSIHVQFLTDETTFRWTYRTDGQPLWNTALTPYKGTATQSPFVTLATRS